MYDGYFNRYMFADAFLYVYSATASAVGTTLLHSPGWNEGKARNETLGVHTDKSRMSSAGAALQREHLPYVSEVPPLWGSINVLTIITQGLRPGLCRSIALTGLFYVLINYWLVLMHLLSCPL